jgi:hypothetical protein
MRLNIEKWDELKEEVGEAYKFVLDGRFHAILETKKDSFRGDHIHPVKQHTLLLSGKGRYFMYDGEGLIERPMVIGEPLSVEPGVPHILLPETDIVTFEWWEGDFISEPCEDIFDEYTRNRIGDEDFHHKDE